MKIEKQAILNLKQKVQENHKIARQNLEKALKNEDFKQNYQLFQEKMIEIAKKEAYGENCDRKQLEQMEVNLQKTLKAMGMEKQSISVNPNCKICNDSFYVDGQKCQCLKSEISKLLYESCGFNKQLHKFQDSNFSVFENSELMKKTYSNLEKWCSNYKNSQIKNIGLFGHAGNGKTFLMECMASSLIENGNFVYFTSAFNMFKNLLKAHTTFDGSQTDIISQFIDCDILFIDDLGVEPIYKNVNENYFYLIVNQRMLENKPIIFSTNLEMEDFLERYGERVFSRLINKKQSKTFWINEHDIRLNKNGIN